MKLIDGKAIKLVQPKQDLIKVKGIKLMNDKTCFYKPLGTNIIYCLISASSLIITRTFNHDLHYTLKLCTRMTIQRYQMYFVNVNHKTSPFKNFFCSQSSEKQKDLVLLFSLRQMNMQIMPFIMLI